MSAKAHSLAKLCFVLMAPFLTAISTTALTINDVWINEIHYDNTGGDVNEFVEIGGIAGTELDKLSLEFYNGSGGAKYSALALSGILDNSANGYGFLGFSKSGLQNGSPDGIALIYDEDSLDGIDPAVLQFLSYEGAFTATSGTASGLTSIDIGVSEPASAAVGSSLQFLGIANVGSWSGPIADTYGEKNTGQILPEIISANSKSNDSVSDPGASLGLLGLSLFAVFSLKRRSTKP